jgi:hypothetical protein
MHCRNAAPAHALPFVREGKGNYRALEALLKKESL